MEMETANSFCLLGQLEEQARVWTDLLVTVGAQNGAADWGMVYLELDGSLSYSVGGQATGYKLPSADGRRVEAEYSASETVTDERSEVWSGRDLRQYGETLARVKDLTLRAWLTQQVLDVIREEKAARRS